MFARIEDEAVAFEQIARVAKADVGVVDREPAQAGQQCQKGQPRDAGANEDEPQAPGRHHSDVRLNSPSGNAQINCMTYFQTGRT